METKIAKTTQAALMQHLDQAAREHGVTQIAVLDTFTFSGVTITVVSARYQGRRLYAAAADLTSHHSITWAASKSGAAAGAMRDVDQALGDGARPADPDAPDPRDIDEAEAVARG